MSELPISIKRKILRNEFKQFNAEYGFKFITPNILLREQNSILQYLYFTVKTGRLDCDIVAQPLYIPADKFTLGISTRIQFLGSWTRTWGYFDRTEEEFSLDVKEMLKLISDGGIRWFKAMGSPQNLIQTTLDPNFKLAQGYAPVLRFEKVAMSHLYLGNIEEGVQYMGKMINEFEKCPGSQVALRAIPEGKQWIDMAQNQSEKLPEKFNEIIAQTRSLLKLR